jgi:gentisate 1,2-dioxygenase
MNGDEQMEWAKLMTDDEYYPKLTKENVRPAKWSWKDVYPKLQELSKDPLKRADRRFVALVNTDTGDASGALPSVFVGIQIINPGEHIEPHRHNSYAVYHILKGKGYSVVNDMKIEWEAGDTFACASWAYHERFNNGDEEAIMYVFQDMVARAHERNLIWEEPVGNVGHVVKGFVPQVD